MRRRRLPFFALIGAAFGLIAGLACLLPGRGSLDAVLLPLATITPLPALLAHLRPHARLPPTLAALAGLTLGLLPALPSIGTVAVLLMWTTLLASGFTPVGRPVRARDADFEPPESPAVPAFLVIVLAWAWLAWPVWLGPQLVAWNASVPAWATQFHPLFAINTAELDRGIWTQQPAIYALTPLGQDLAYALPDTPWPAVGAMTVTILIVLGARRFFRRRTPTRPAAP